MSELRAHRATTPPRGADRAQRGRATSRSRTTEVQHTCPTPTSARAGIGWPAGSWERTKPACRPGSSIPGELFPGRHSNRTEIAAETPIFHDLTLRWPTHGRSRTVPSGRIPAPRTDPLTEFRRNPLTAPIPVQVNAEPQLPLGPQTRRAMPAGTPAMTLVTSTGAHALPEQPRRHGRHHRPGR